MADTKCKSKEGHEYKTNGDTMSCLNCPRVQKYDPVTRKWNAVNK